MTQLSEPLVIQDIYVSDLAEIEHVGDGNYRLTYSTRQRSSYGGEMEDIVVCRLILPVSAIIAAMNLVAGTLGIKCVDIGMKSLEMMN